MILRSKRRIVVRIGLAPAPGQIDPLKEIQAARERIDAGISTLSRETAALTGEEWEKTHRQGVKEKRMRERNSMETF